MTASSVIMIRPTAFGFNAETALSNSFQHPSNLSSTKIQSAALKEFEALASKLTEHGIEVILFNDTVTPVKPDAVFPNNWFSTHADGTLFFYPMLSEVRRKERREDVIERLRQQFFVKQIIDFTSFENQSKYLEGTGSIVFDHSNKTAYANLSPRTNAELLKLVADEIGYSPVTFKATDRNGNEIYHTNVLLSISDNLLIVCCEAIADKQGKFKKQIEAARKQIVYLNYTQLENFAGNMLMLQNNSGKNFMVMSKRAYESLRQTQIESIEQHATILYAPLNTIEEIGGGSARCMLAENFLPRLL